MHASFPASILHASCIQPLLAFPTIRSIDFVCISLWLILEPGRRFRWINPLDGLLSRYRSGTINPTLPGHIRSYRFQNMDAGIYEAPPVATEVNTIALAFTVVAGLIVSLRLFARIFLTSLFGPEDVFIVLAMVSATLQLSPQMELTIFRAFRLASVPQFRNKPHMVSGDTFQKLALMSNAYFSR